ncbi:MAG: hypothetical protein WC175_01890 [Candidatus Dojkabacteria bacterium]
MAKKVLFVSPEIPSGGTGVYIWQLAQATKKWSDWESYIVSPMLKPQLEIAKTLDGYHKVETRKRKMFWGEGPLQLLEEAYLYAQKNDFDMVYFNSDHAFSTESYLLKGFTNAVCSIHIHEPYLKKFDTKKPITDQISSLRPSRRFKKLMNIKDQFATFHLISKLEEDIFNTLGDYQKYVVYPNLLYSTEKYYPSNFEDRSDKIIFSGRITNYIKGLEIIRGLVDNTDFEFTMTIPYGSISKAQKFFRSKKNCEILYYPKHENALQELAQHKVFVNAGTYGPFDLTMLEAANQGCQIVSNTCIGATNYFNEFFKPEEHTWEGFEKAIEKALKEEKPSRIIPNNMEFNIQHFLDTLYRNCIREKEDKRCYSYGFVQ